MRFQLFLLVFPFSLSRQIRIQYRAETLARANVTTSSLRTLLEISYNRQVVPSGLRYKPPAFQNVARFFVRSHGVETQNGVRVSYGVRCLLFSSPV